MADSRPRLTPHQRDVYQELVRVSAKWDGAWIDARVIGAKAALEHLVDKGYAERKIDHGPRGGEYRSYRPIS